MNILTIEEFSNNLNKIYNNFNSKPEIKRLMKSSKNNLINAYKSQDYYDKLLKKDKWLGATLQGQLSYVLVGATTPGDKLDFLVNCRDKEYIQKHKIVNVDDCNNQVVLTLVGEIVYKELFREIQMSMRHRK